jgi:hypothetical protein
VIALLFPLLFALVCAGGFAVGLRFFRMSEPPAGATLDQVRRFGRLLMMSTTAMLVFLVVLVVRGDIKAWPA